MNKTISDIIEEFIKSSMDDDSFIELSRNDLAKFFSCVPSQINYVLNTRFTINNGFVVESQRGGGGYIKVTRLTDNNENYLKSALDNCREPIDLTRGNQIVNGLKEKGIITEDELSIIKSAISVKALNNPINIDNILRSNILKQVIIEIMKRNN